MHLMKRKKMLFCSQYIQNTHYDIISKLYHDKKTMRNYNSDLKMQLFMSHFFTSFDIPKFWIHNKNVISVISFKNCIIIFLNRILYMSSIGLLFSFILTAVFLREKYTQIKRVRAVSKATNCPF